jgi:tetratricopeptide (TPR) repeat protein
LPIRLPGSNSGTSSLTPRKYASALTQAHKLTVLTKSRLGVRHPQHVAALERLGLAYAALGRDRRAVAVAEQVTELARSRNVSISSEFADMLMQMVPRYDLTGRHHDGASVHSNVLRIRLALLKRRPKANELGIAVAATELAAAIADDGDLAQAAALHTFALAIRERKLGGRHLQVAESLHGLAVLAVKQDRRDDAERHYRRVLAIREDKLGPTHGDVADILEELADSLSDARREEAEALRERAEIIRRTDRPSFIRGPLVRPGLRPAPPPTLAPGLTPPGTMLRS